MARPTVLALFRAGHDTSEIARILRLKNEAEALKRLTVERSAMLHLPVPYKTLATDGPAKPAKPPVGKRKLARPPIGLRCGA